MIQSALHEAQLEREQIEVLAVGLGPVPTRASASRSPLRRAGNWRRGGVKLLGISSAECVAAQAQAEKYPGPRECGD